MTEVPLLEDSNETSVGAEHDATGRSATPNRRRPARIALASGAVILLIAVSIVAIVRAAGSDETAPPTSTDASELAGTITTPATLRPLDTLPRVDDPALTEEPVSGGPQPTTSQDRTLFDSVVVPAYPGVPGIGLTDLVAYDIGAAVTLLADDVPRRSETHLELGTAGFVLDVVIVRDPERDRYQVTVDSRGESQVAIVDVETGTTYVDTAEGPIEVPNDEIIDGSTATTINDYFDRLLLGPLRPDTYTATSTRGRSLVEIDGIGPARHFIANVRGDLIPEWQIYAFGPVFEFPVEDRPSLLEYHVYVTEGGDIAQVDGVSLVGDVPQLVQHTVTILDEPIVVELPDRVDAPSETTAPTTAAA